MIIFMILTILLRAVNWPQRSGRAYWRRCDELTTTTVSDRIVWANRPKRCRCFSCCWWCCLCSGCCCSCSDGAPPNNNNQSNNYDNDSDDDDDDGGNNNNDNDGGQRVAYTAYTTHGCVFVLCDVDFFTTSIKLNP